MASTPIGEGALPSPLKLNWTAPKRSFFSGCYRIHNRGWYGQFTIEWSPGKRFCGYFITEFPWSFSGFDRPFADVQTAQSWCEDYLVERCMVLMRNLGWTVTADKP